MKKQTLAQLEKRKAHLEFIEDQLSAELSYMDELLRSVGFPQGLLSVKEVAREMLKDRLKE